MTQQEFKNYKISISGGSKPQTPTPIRTLTQVTIITNQETLVRQFSDERNH